jgi:hypothetical protein
MHTAVAGISHHLLTDAQLVELLRTHEDRLPRATAEEFVRRGDWMVGPLTEICRDERAWRQDGPAFWAPVHASFLLGAVGGSTALRGLTAALRWSARNDIDWVWDALPSMLGRLGRAAVPALRAVAFDAAAGEHERILAVHALAAVAAHFPIEQGEILDLLRSSTEDEEEDGAIRGASALALLAFARPGDRKAALAEALRQKWSDAPPLFDEQDIDAAYARREPELAVYRQDWMRFYDPERIAERQLRWREEEQDARWSLGAAAGAEWVEVERGRLLAGYERAVEELDDLTRGEALWVAESMTEYLVRHEGAAPWRWNGRTAFAYLMDAFARRVAADLAGRIASVPDAMARFVRFCASEGLVRGRDYRDALDRIEAEREDFVAASLDPERRRAARAQLERLVAAGVDPARPEEKGTRFRPAPESRPLSKGTGRRTKR